MALLDALKRRKGKTRIHSSINQFASMSLASSSLQSPLSQVAGSGSGWQKKAWEFYDVVPEMRLVVGYRGAALSKVKLQIARRTPDGNELITDGRSEQMLETLFGGIANHGASLERYAQHLTVAGETYTFVVKGDDGKDDWLIVPPDHVNFNRRILRFTNPITGEDSRHDVEQVFNWRLWNPHPLRFWEADSPTRGAISSLDKIMHIDASIKTTAMSRLVGAGILPWPLEANLPMPAANEENLTPLDAFQKRLFEAMTASLGDPNSAARHTPIFVPMPAEAIAALPKEPIKFWSKFDETAPQLRDTEIRRYAAGQPLPTEMITGVGDVNHWTGWQLSEEDLKFDIAPLAETICASLTVQVVQQVMGEDFLVEPDFSDLVSRPNRTPEAIELRAVGAISLNELRESAGYAPVDGGNDVGGSPEPGTEEVIRVDSDRTVPLEIDRAEDPATFAVADIVARDVVYTAGQWLLTHSGRANRGQLSEIGALDRHTVFAADMEVLGEAVKRVKPKYADVISDQVFDSVVAYVGHIFDGRECYSRQGLVEWVRRGH